MLAARRVCVDGAVVDDGRYAINAFSYITLDDEVLQSNPAYYVMLHKPRGCVSATADKAHRTVIDLLNLPFKETLHLAGRLDFNSTGLLLLTNNGQWSRRITAPEVKTPKTYRVTTAEPIVAHAAEVFAQGMYLAFEDLTTQPAQLTVLSVCEARLTIYEGRYHQVKRMFGALGNWVVQLHRESMGDIVLDSTLAAGEYRALTAEEIAVGMRHKM